MIGSLSCVLVCATLAGVTANGEGPQAVLRAVPGQGSPSLEASLSEMLGRLGVQLVTQTDVAKPIAIIELDLTAGRIVVESPSRAVTIRRSLPADLTGEVRSEAAATLIASAVDVLLHTDPPRQPVKIDAPVEATTPVSVPRAAVSPVGLDFGVGLGAMRTGGPNALDFGGSVHVLLGVPVAQQLPGLLARVTYQPGFELEGETVALRGQLFSARVFAQLEMLRWAHGRLEAGAGGGLDSFSFASFQREGELLRPIERRRALAPIISGLITYRLPVGEHVHLFAMVSVDGDLRPGGGGRAPMRVPGEPEDVRPWTVRPMLQLGVSFAPLSARV